MPSHPKPLAGTGTAAGGTRSGTSRLIPASSRDRPLRASAERPVDTFTRPPSSTLPRGRQSGTPNKAVRAPHATEPDPNDLPDDSTRSRRHEQDDPPRRPELEDQPVDTDRMPVLNDQEGDRNYNKRADEKAGVKWPPCGGPRRLRPGFGGTAYTRSCGATVMSLAIAWGLFAHGAFSLSGQCHGRCPGGVSSWTCPPDPPCTGGTPERTGEGRDAGVRGDRHASCCGTIAPR